MAIKIIEGNIYCSICEKVIEKEDIFKLNEFSFQIACSTCVDKGVFKNSYVDCHTRLKDEIYNLIMKYVKSEKTATIDRKDSIKEMIKIFS